MVYHSNSEDIIVFGVPGTGKSVIGSRLARRIGYRFITLSWFVLQNGYWRDYDRQRRSFIIDYEALLSGLSDLLNERYVIETHWLEPFLEALNPLLIIFTRTHPLVLFERLKRRAWPHKKIVENVEAELLGVLVPEVEIALDKGIRVLELDTSNVSVQEAVDKILEFLRNRDKVVECCIDWLSRLNENELEKIMGILSSN